MTPRILLVAGPRPEIIKLAPVYHALKALPDVEVQVLHVRQQTHEAMAPFREMDYRPDFTSTIINRQRNTLGEQTAEILDAVDQALVWMPRPHLVLVQGDTSTTLGAALAAFYQQIPVGHVEAGLRTHAAEPFPEEMNRRLVDQIASIHFAPTRGACMNLSAEGVGSAMSRYVTGNPVVDVLAKEVAARPLQSPPGVPLVLITCHRRERLDERLRLLVDAVKRLEHGPLAPIIIWPVHPNPAVDDYVRKHLAESPAVCLLGPKSYREFIALLGRVALVVTDSGGVIEEATTLGKPLVIIRDVTERPEALEHGGHLVPMRDMPHLAGIVETMLRGQRLRPLPAPGVLCTVFGDGHAGERIAQLAVDYCRRS